MTCNAADPLSSRPALPRKPHRLAQPAAPALAGAMPAGAQRAGARRAGLRADRPAGTIKGRCPLARQQAAAPRRRGGKAPPVSASAPCRPEHAPFRPFHALRPGRSARTGAMKA